MKGFPLSGSPLLTSLNLSTATWQSLKIPPSLSLGVFHASDNSRLRELRVPLFLAKTPPPVTFALLVAVEENRIEKETNTNKQEQ